MMTTGIIYSQFEVALLWCGAEPSKLETYLKEITKPSIKVWQHEKFPDLNSKFRILNSASSDGLIIACSSTGNRRAASELCPKKRHFWADDLKKYFETYHPHEKPSFLFGKEQTKQVENIHTMPLALEIANKAYARYWGNMPDPHDTTQHKTNEVIAEWIILASGGKITPSMAGKIAQIIRPEWAAKGRHKES